jgi:CheY-like chemotaxis protein
MANEPVFLYVEDDPASRMVLQMLLTRGLGFSHVNIFENSLNFLERLENLQEKPTIIFVDIHMKPHDGFEMLNMIRTHEAYQNIPVIALTASVMNEEVIRLRSSGFNGAISKPVNQRSFPDLLNQLLDGKEVWHIK